MGWRIMGASWTEVDVPRRMGISTANDGRDGWMIGRGMLPGTLRVSLCLRNHVIGSLLACSLVLFLVLDR